VLLPLADPPCDSHFAAPPALEWVCPTSAQVAEALIGPFAGSLGRLVSLVAFTADRTAQTWHKRAASLTVLTWLDMGLTLWGGRRAGERATRHCCDVTRNVCTRTVSALSRPALWKRCRRYALQHHAVGSAAPASCYGKSAAGLLLPRTGYTQFTVSRDSFLRWIASSTLALSRVSSGGN
jgi:hypothetical protein